MWKQIVAQGLGIIENTVRDEYELKRARRTDSLSSQPDAMEPPFSFVNTVSVLANSGLAFIATREAALPPLWSEYIPLVSFDFRFTTTLLKGTNELNGFSSRRKTLLVASGH